MVQTVKNDSIDLSQLATVLQHILAHGAAAGTGVPATAPQGPSGDSPQSASSNSPQSSPSDNGAHNAASLAEIMSNLAASDLSVHGSCPSCHVNLAVTNAGIVLASNVTPAPNASPQVSTHPAGATLASAGAPASASSVGATPLVPAASAGGSGDTAGDWYAVTVGRRVGVFEGWMNVGPLVHKLSGFVAVKYPTRALAQAAFDNASANGNVIVRQ